jgi:hypothetical protein
MEKNEFQILQKKIPRVKIPSLTGMTWFDSNDIEVPWTQYDTPSTGSTVYNENTGLTIGYYQWATPIDLNWNFVNHTGTTDLNRQIYNDHQIPIFIESTMNEMGVMVGFDGDIEQVEQFCNFTYTYTGNLLTIYNSLNTNRLKTLIDSEFLISWGDGSTDTLLMPTVYDSLLPNISHAYSGGTTGTTVTITVDSPWKVQSITRTFILPFSGYTFPTDFDILTFEIPFSNPISGVTQDYLNDYEYTEGFTGSTTGTTSNVVFIAIGKSRIDEKKGYGKYASYTGLTTGGTTTIDDVVYNFTGYTIDGLYYMDIENGSTQIEGRVPAHFLELPPTGFTYGNSTDYATEFVYNNMLTRNEHLIGFVDDTQIFSDIFVERGKLGVMERNLRLGEIDNMGELTKYGSGYFNVKKQ